MSTNDAIAKVTPSDWSAESAVGSQVKLKARLLHGHCWAVTQTPANKYDEEREDHEGQAALATDGKELNGSKLQVKECVSASDPNSCAITFASPAGKRPF